MSTHDPHGETQAPQEEDRIEYSKILLVSAVSLLVFIVGGVWAAKIQVDTEQEVIPTGPKPVSDEASQIEIGLVNVGLFSQDRRAEERVAEQEKRLHSYGWADPEKKTIHVPIEEVIRQTLKEQGK
ncbi:MAG TPA: hypothetical protein VEY30_11850 [Myxococcaceae bacterium]|nr:hypothetical protein [Myxococcaceae bacterium]